MRREMNMPWAVPDVVTEIPGVRVWGRSRRLQHQFGEFIVWLVRLWSH
jgi:hypothetical protein